MTHTNYKAKTIKTKLLDFDIVEFAGHAIEQMAIRNISEKNVLDAIREPEETGLSTQPGRQRVRKSIDEYR